MTMKIRWDELGERRYETGVDHGVLYLPTNGVYNEGVPWNGLTTVTESPSGAEPTAQYADNIKYLNLMSAEQFSATVEAFTYPREFEPCDGSAVPQPGVSVGQQNRKPFGFSYRSLLGNDTEGTDFGYKLHLVYNAQASPSEKARTTVNETPEAMPFSWSVSTTPVPVNANGPDGKPLRPTAHLTIDSTQVDADALAALEDILYGTAGTDPRLPMPDEVIALFDGTITEATPTEPGFTSATGEITIPTVAGVIYRRDDTSEVVEGTVVVPGGAGDSLVISAQPEPGYTFPPNTDEDWQFTRTA